MGQAAGGEGEGGGADGGAYIGFNPFIPNKIGSFGGSFNVTGGRTDEVSTLLDLNGDSLPDKVFVGADGNVYWRQNLRRPGGATNALRIRRPSSDASSPPSATASGICRRRRSDPPSRALTGTRPRTARPPCPPSTG